MSSSSVNVSLSGDIAELRKDVESLSRRANSMTYVFNGVLVLPTELESVKGALSELGVSSDELCYGAIHEVRYAFPCPDKRYANYKAKVSLELESILQEKIKGSNSSVSTINRKRAGKLPKFSCYKDKTEREKIFHSYYQYCTKPMLEYFQNRGMSMKIGRDYKILVGVKPNKYLLFTDVLKANPEIQLPTFEEFLSKTMNTKKELRNKRKESSMVSTSGEANPFSEGPDSKKIKH